jgi:hypothetical protein
VACLALIESIVGAFSSGWRHSYFSIRTIVGSAGGSQRRSTAGAAYVACALTMHSRQM